MPRGGGKHKGRGRKDYLGRGLLGPMPKALKPKGSKKIRKQATRTMRAIYRPGFADLRGQERRINAVSQKRAEDNKKYLNWLDTQTKQLTAHAKAADTELKSAQQQIQQQAQDSFTELRDQLVAQGGNFAGTVTNANQATAHDVTPEAQRSIERIANERQRTAQTTKSGQDLASVAASSNFALMAASDAKRQADQYNALKDVASARQKLVLERAAKTAEEVARLLDTEIAKAQSRSEIRGQAAQLALGLKEHRLAKKSFKLDKKVQLAQLDLSGRQLDETERHNRATEGLTRRGQNIDRRQGSGGSGGKSDRRQDARNIKHATRRYLKTYPPPKKRKHLRTYITTLQDDMSKREGIQREGQANRIVRRMVLRWIRKHRGA